MAFKVIGLFGILVLAGYSKCAAQANEDTLELLQVMIRHGNRTATSALQQFSTDFAKLFEPFQNGHLTPQGRRHMYSVGSYFRDHYGAFLPGEYAFEEVAVKCAATDRVQESSAVTMAAIFPPKDKQIWQNSGLGSLWTPIPCESVPSDQDTLLDASEVDCPRYAQLQSEVLNSTFFWSQYYQLTQNGAINNYIQRALNLSQSPDQYDLVAVFEGLLAMENYNLPLPGWSAAVYPSPLTEIKLLFFHEFYLTPELIRFTAGELLKEMLAGATLVEQGQHHHKMAVYFGHDSTIYALLVGLGFEKSPPMCLYGSALILELHRNKKTSELGYKFLYHNSTSAVPVHYVVPGCQEICPLPYVKKYVEQYLPTKPFHDYCFM